MLTPRTLLNLVFYLFLLPPLTRPSHGEAMVEVLQDLITGPRRPSTSLAADTDGTLYGTTEYGGTASFGAFYKVSSAGAVTFLHEFEQSLSNQSRLCLGGDGWLYGTSRNGGTLNQGCIFRLSKTGEFEMLHDFNIADTGYPNGELIEVSPGQFYGTAQGGASLSRGVIFRFSVSNGFEIMRLFEVGQGVPSGALVRGNDGNLYGATYLDLFRISPDGTVFEDLHSFPIGTGPVYYPEGRAVQSPLTLASDGKFYGVTQDGGHRDHGTVFSLTESGTVTILHHFETTFLVNRGLVEGPDGLLYGTGHSAGSTKIGPASPERFRISKSGTFEKLVVPAAHQGDYGSANAVFVGDASFITTIGKQTGEQPRGGTIVKYSPTDGYQTIYLFGVGNGYGSSSRLHLASDGNLYANVNDGGAFANGGLARIKPSEGVDFSLASEHFQTRFLCYYGFTEGSGKTLYGAGLSKSILKVPLDGSPASVRSLDSAEKPELPFVRGSDGNLYTISSTAVGEPPQTNYTYHISRLDETAQSAKLTIVHTFSELGEYDAPISLALGSDGALYGNTKHVVFRFSAGGGYSVIHVSARFITNVSEGFDGAYYALVDTGAVESPPVKFVKIMLSGGVVTLRDCTEYVNSLDLQIPTSFLRANDGNFYGPAPEGIVRITPLGDVTLVHPLPPGEDIGLGLAGDGSIYGLTQTGGVADAGQLFRIAIPPYPPIEKSTFTTAIVGSGGWHGGTLSLNVTSQGILTGKLVEFGSTWRFRGTPDSNGNLTVVLKQRRDRDTPRLLQLKIDSSVTPAILTAIVYSGEGGFLDESDRSIAVASDVSTLPESVAPGRRTLHFAQPPDPKIFSYPIGHSWASVVVTASGSVRLAGKLADGGLLSGGFKLQGNGMGLLQTANLKPRGSIMAHLNFSPSEAGELSGVVAWRRTRLPGIEVRAPAFLSAYHRPPAGQNVLTYIEPALNATFATDPFNSIFGSYYITPNDKAIPTESNDFKLSLSIGRRTGVFRGSFSSRDIANVPVKFNGLFDQTAQQGFGMFSRGANGAVTLTPK